MQWRLREPGIHRGIAGGLSLPNTLASDRPPAAGIVGHSMPDHARHASPRSWPMALARIPYLRSARQAVALVGRAWRVGGRLRSLCIRSQDCGPSGRPPASAIACSWYRIWLVTSGVARLASGLSVDGLPGADDCSLLAGAAVLSRSCPLLRCAPVLGTSQPCAPSPLEPSSGTATINQRKRP